MSSEKSEASKPYKLLLNFTDEKNYKRSDKDVTL